MNKELVLAEAPWLTAFLLHIQRQRPGKGDLSKSLLERRCDTGSGWLAALICSALGLEGAVPKCFHIAMLAIKAPQAPSIKMWDEKEKCQQMAHSSLRALPLGPLGSSCIGPLLGSPNATARPRPPPRDTGLDDCSSSSWSP